MPTRKRGPSFRRHIAPFAPVALALAMNSAGKPSIASGSAHTFTPECTLPFAGVRNPPIDDRCGIQGGSADPAKQAESRTKNNFCAETGSPGEGKYISYIAFVKNAHYSDVAAGEAVNCNIPGNDTNDIHIVLLKDPNDDECLSTTAEMSPHYRPADWTPENLNASTGHPVRVQGQLFFDGSHTPCSGSSRPNPKRASLWEIHPVYSVEVCSQTTIAECQSSTAEWTSLGKLFSSEEQ